MPTNKLKFNDLPRALQRQLEWDVKFIKEFNETILRLRSLELRFGDRGRYEAEWRENNDSIVEQLQKATDRIDGFLLKAQEKGYQGQDVLDELSYQQPMPFSQDSLTYFR